MGRENMNYTHDCIYQLYGAYPSRQEKMKDLSKMELLVQATDISAPILLAWSTNIDRRTLSEH